jgi:hypothetical protein
MDANRSEPVRKSRWNADDFGTTLVGSTLFLCFGVANFFGWLSRRPEVGIWERIGGIAALSFGLMLIVLYIVSVIRAKPTFSDTHQTESGGEPQVWD